MSVKVKFLPSGDTAVTLQFDGVIDMAMSRRVIALGKRLCGANIPGLVETVPAYRSLLVHYSPLLTSQSELIEHLKPLLKTLTDEEHISGRHWQFPVCFDGPDFAPDLATVAQWSGDNTAELIRRLVSTQLYVYMIGFAAGQPYLGDLPDCFDIPRRTTPVASIPAGSILVATGKAVIYPFLNPTGWYAIARTPVRLFDLNRNPVALLEPGDTVDFYRIPYEEFDDMSEVSAIDLSSQ